MNTNTNKEDYIPQNQTENIILSILSQGSLTKTELMNSVSSRMASTQKSIIAIRNDLVARGLVTYNKKSRLLSLPGVTNRQHLGSMHRRIKLSPEYTVWRNMHKRCSSKTDENYKHYGGRGISVCARWNKFENFLADMGPKPTPKHSIDRIRNDEGYSPENCRWILLSQQARNRRNNRKVIAYGVTRLLVEWSEISGIHSRTLRSRLNNGWTPEDAVSRPIQIKKRKAA